MFGMSRDDAALQQVAAKYREGFMPYRGGFAVKPSRNSDPIYITSDQREQMVAAYGAAYALAMRVMMALVVVGLGAWIAVSVSWNFPFVAWPIMLLLCATAAPTYAIVQNALRTTIAGFGPRPEVSASDYAAWQRQRLRGRSWASILLPILAAPSFLVGWHTHFPPRDSDDCLAILVATGFTALVVWYSIRKWRAERD